ncbi:MAG: hypothetical protein FWG88_01430 [Oscillospiraceae bacterium]|nr:hypothetical protein [Oscillospiraceae bacterium]
MLIVIFDENIYTVVWWMLRRRVWEAAPYKRYGYIAAHIGSCAIQMTLYVD